MTEQRSKELFAEAVGHFPGGVNSPVRAMRSVGREFPHDDAAIDAVVAAARSFFGREHG